MASLAAIYAANFLKTLHRHLLSESRQNARWKKPSEGVIKLNSDGVFNGERKDGGWGFVLRDDQGRVIKAGARRESFLLDALHAELLGCTAGLQEAARLGISQLQIETDATPVKTAMETDDFRHSTVGGIITDEMKHLLDAELPSCKISVCNCVCNGVADALAAHGCFLVDIRPLGRVYLMRLRQWSPAI